MAFAISERANFNESDDDVTPNESRIGTTRRNVPYASASRPALETRKRAPPEAADSSAHLRTADFKFWTDERLRAKSFVSTEVSHLSFKGYLRSGAGRRDGATSTWILALGGSMSVRRSCSRRADACLCPAAGQFLCHGMSVSHSCRSGVPSR